MLSTKNTDCNSFPELEVTHQKQEWCHKWIAKSTRRNWASDFRGFHCQPAPDTRQSPMRHLVQMRTPQTLSFSSLWGVWERQRGSRLLAVGVGLSSITGLGDFLLCAGLHKTVNQPLQTLVPDPSPVLNPYSTISSLSQSAGIESDAYFQRPPSNSSSFQRNLREQNAHNSSKIPFRARKRVSSPSWHNPFVILSKLLWALNNLLSLFTVGFQH